MILGIHKACDYIGDPPREAQRMMTIINVPTSRDINRPRAMRDMVLEWFESPAKGTLIICRMVFSFNHAESYVFTWI